MFSYEYVKDYTNNTSLIKSYYSFTQNIFSFEMSNWRDKGFWRDNYIPHSLVFDNQVIANISACIMNLQINGVAKRAVQLGSVGVLPKFRGKGLARILMEKVLDEYSEYPLIFLFASDDVSGFYKRFGFMRIDESIPYINVENNNPLNKPKNITLESDKINDLLNKNTQYSSIIDARGNPNIYWFHLLYSFKNSVYYIPEKDVLFIAKYRDNTVDLYDVMSKNKIKFKEIESYILNKDINRVNFHFTPDWLDVNYRILPRDDNALYVYGELDTDMTRARFPKTSTT